MGYKEEEFVENWYLGKRDILDLKEANQSIGSHAYSHRPLARLSDDQAKYELAHSKFLLEKLVDEDIAAISYPFGNVDAVTAREFRIAEEVGYKFGFTEKGSEHAFP